MILALVVAVLAALFLLSGVAFGENEKMNASFGKALSPFADAIGHAEGFFTSGSRPNRNNNPGDFILAPPATAYTNKSDGTYAIFDTAQDGWQALEDQLDLIRRGASGHYNANMSFIQMAQVYSPDGADNWAKNVADRLGASPEESIGGYL